MTTRLAIIGRSSSGKDLIAGHIMRSMGTNNCAIMKMYTTRSQRNSEDTDYDFLSKDEFMRLIDTGEIVEYRNYPVIVNGKSIDTYYGYGKKHLLQEKKMLIMSGGTFECLQKIYSNDDLKELPITPLYVYGRKEAILKRAIERESFNSNPSYPEVCRRFLDGENQFGKLDMYLEEDPDFIKSSHSDLLKLVVRTNDLRIKNLTNLKTLSILRNIGDPIILHSQVQHCIGPFQDPSLSVTG